MDRSELYGGALSGRSEVERRLQSTSARHITNPGKIAAASAVWMGGTFALCYLLLPLARAGLGLSAQSLAGVVLVAGSAALSLAVLWVVMAAGLLVKKPTVELEDGHHDRALTATMGSLLVWSILHNVLPGLIPFGGMGSGELLAFLGANIIESALFGVMLASITETIRGAFSLGMLFQGVLLLSSYAVMMIV